MLYKTRVVVDLLVDASTYNQVDHVVDKLIENCMEYSPTTSIELKHEITYKQQVPVLNEEEKEIMREYLKTSSIIKKWLKDGVDVPTVYKTHFNDGLYGFTVVSRDCFSWGGYSWDRDYLVPLRKEDGKFQGMKEDTEYSLDQLGLKEYVLDTDGNRVSKKGKVKL